MQSTDHSFEVDGDNICLSVAAKYKKEKQRRELGSQTYMTLLIDQTNFNLVLEVYTGIFPEILQCNQTVIRGKKVRHAVTDEN